MSEKQKPVEAATDEHFREYLNLHNQKKGIETRMKFLKEILVPALQDGVNSPSDLPYRLALQERTQTAYEWKDSFFKFLRRLWRSEKKAQAHIDLVQASFQQTTIEALVVEKNPDYQIEGKDAAA